VPANLESSRSGKPSLARRGVAALVVVAAALLVFHFIAGLVLAVFWIAVVVIAIGAIAWAANQLL
jgi:hypothetical protein